MSHFARPQLAQQLALDLQGENPFSDAPNGCFLAAPRRTGKSTFLRQDLAPELVRNGVIVIYVDLWADQKRDPGLLIADAIGRALQEHLGAVAKAAKASGLESVSIAGWLKIDTSKIGKIDGTTITDALRALHDTAEKPVALLIDEAQHALTSSEGENAMAAMKSARDQLNAPGDIQLMLVMSGSDRDKLLRLVNNNNAPFFGSQIRHMPELDKAFTDHVASMVENQRADLRPVDTKLLFDAFRLFGNRPQFYMDALGKVLNPMAGLTERFELALLKEALQKQSDDEAQMDAEFLALSAVEQAVLWRLLEMGERFRAYDQNALAFYTTTVNEPVKTPQVQNALESLRQRTPSMVWKSARGEYAVEDAAMHRWYAGRVRQGHWPPPA